MKIVLKFIILGINEELKANPLKNHKLKRRGNFIRYNSHVDENADKRYNYELTDEDIKFMKEIKPPAFTIEEFERLINLFEKENYNVDNKISLFPGFVWKYEEELIKRNNEGVKQIYDYWNQIRSDRLNKGLMRKYWRPPDPNNANPRVTFRSCKDEKHNLRRARKYDEEHLRKVYFLY